MLKKSFLQSALPLFSALLLGILPCALQSAEGIGSQSEPSVTVHEVESYSQPEDFTTFIGYDKVVNWDAFDFSSKSNLHRIGVMIETDALKSATTDWSSELSRHENRVRIKEAQAQFLTKKSGNVVRLFDNFPLIEMLVTDEELKSLMAAPQVVSIEPETIVYRKLRQGIPQMRATAVRNQFQGSGITVAILDTGIDYLHPQLGGGPLPNAKVIGGIDTAENDNDPIPFGDDAHGTACAGIVAGDIIMSGDYIGGVAPMAKLAAVKVFPDGGGSTTSFAVVSGIDWCVSNKNLDASHPIMVINMSLGGGEYNSACDGDEPAYTAAINSAFNSGITVLAASGNEGFCDAIGAPSCVQNAISVGALFDEAYGEVGNCVESSTCHPSTEPNGGCSTGTAVFTFSALDKVTAYSNTAHFLDLFAPSGRVATTDISGQNGYSTTNFASDFGGTSAATPYASGAVALLQSASKSVNNRYLTPTEVKAILTNTGYDVTDTKDGGINPGITKPAVDLQNAVNFIVQGKELLSAEGLELNVVIDLDPGQQSLVVSKTTSGTTAYSTSESIPWLTVDMPTGSFSGTDLTLDVSIDITGLGLGNYTGSIYFASDEAFNSPLQIPITLEVMPNLGEFIEIPDGTVISSGNANWVKDTNFSFQGGSSVRSGDINDSEVSTLLIEIPDSALEMTFRYRVSSETNWDFLNIYTDSDVQDSFSGEISSWTEIILDVSQNSIFKAEYQKDVSVSSGSDAAWIDAVNFSGLPASAITNPIPSHGAVEVPIDQILEWTKSGLVRQKYDVYLGTSLGQMTLIGSDISELSFAPELNGGPVFYWQVTSKNSLGSANSPVYSFTVINDSQFHGWLYH